MTKDRPGARGGVTVAVDWLAILVTCNVCGDSLASYPQRQVNAQPRAFKTLIDQTIRKHRREKSCEGTVQVTRVEVVK